MWNIREENTGWAAALGELLHAGTDRADDTLMGVEDINVGEPFGPLERHDVAWTHHTTRQQVLDMVASRSYVITLSHPRRQALLGQVRELLDTHPDLAGTEDVAMPYVSHCHRAEQA